ncbi:DUF1573 domain-containing protein [Pontibacter sp. G13]|uniref:DUF1573 domain-containing protein n=1 Tax=Pontibacter sp. G13 TaxID=3074898 RepID=UPI00288C163F|nr:DUF1573 domain-containing protein [Pontibacter sp. G13]WNJ18036.1 DUF1573 domain-containing protein [Pontibacter sp. G13]
MKKILSFCMAAIVGLGLYSCGSDNGSADAAPAVAAPTTTPTSANTPPAPAKPPHQEQAEAMSPTTVEWYEETYNYGQVPSGTVVAHRFSFKNTGDQPLKLTKVKPSCGCTTPEWSQEEIAPGAEGFIDVKFNSAGKSGMQNKSITVTGNFANFNKILKISGEVTAAE